MKLVTLALIILLTAFAPAKANISLADLKAELQERPDVILGVEDYGNIDFRTRKEKKQDRKNRTNMSKKFGPIVMGVKLRNTRNSNVNFKLDLIEAAEIVNKSHNVHDVYTALQPDEKHTLFGPELRSEIKGAISLISQKGGESLKAISEAVPIL